MLTLYGHYVSQPSRAVLWLMAWKKIPHQFVKINPQAGEAETDEFLAKFPAGVVPALEVPAALSPSGNVVYLTEGAAILQFLCDAFRFEELYPSADIVARSRIQQWMHWHHGNLRRCTTDIFRPLMREFMGLPPSKSIISPTSLERVMRENMLVLTHGALKSTPFLVGNGATIADLLCYCELDQLQALHAYDFAVWPEVNAWMERMKQLPEHDAVRKSLWKLAEGILEKKRKSNL